MIHCIKFQKLLNFDNKINFSIIFSQLPKKTNITAKNVNNSLHLKFEESISPNKFYKLQNKKSPALIPYSLRYTTQLSTFLYKEVKEPQMKKEL